MHKFTRLASVQLISWNILEKYHVDPGQVFRTAGLDPQEMHKDNGRYSPQQICDLWREMERVISDPCFGLAAGECWHPSYLGTLGYSLLMSHSLRELFERYVRYNSFIVPNLSAKITEDFANKTLTLHYPIDYKELRSRPRELGMLSWGVSIIRNNFKGLIPVRIEFVHPESNCPSRYLEIFKTDVTFNNPSSSITITTKDADKKLTGGSAELINMCDQVLARYIAKQSTDNSPIVQQTRAVILDNLATGKVTIDKVSKQLGLGSKTLQRRLQDEGKTFSVIYDNTRKNLARRYLTDEKRDMAEVAYLLGFSEQSSFTRSFKKWTGLTPSEYKQEQEKPFTV